MKHLRFLALLVPLVACHPAAAEPAWKNELTSAEPGTWPKLPPCSLSLQVSWKGMVEAGRLNIDFTPRDVSRPGSLVVRSTAASKGPAALLFPYQCHFWSEIDPASLKPRHFHAVETDRRETVTTTVRHFPGRVEAVEITQPLHQAAAPERAEHVFPHSPVFDIFSAMLHVRSRKLETGDAITLLIQPFDHPYLLRVKVTGREIHRDRRTIRLSVGMRKIDRKTLELRPYTKMKRDATLWLSDDQDRVPVELRASVFIGDVRAVLTDFRK